MNQTARQLFDEYRDLMRATLEIEQTSPERFEDPHFAEGFRLVVERINVLIGFYSDLAMMNPN